MDVCGEAMDVLVSARYVARWLFIQGFSGVTSFGVQLKSRKEASKFPNNSTTFTINTTRTGPLLGEKSAINGS